jgi:AraC-like DNA-binding protein
MDIQTGNIKQFLILIITFYGFLLSALISIGQLIADAKSIKNWLLLGLFFVFSLFQIHYIFFEMNLLNDYKIVNIFPIMAYYLLGPVMFFITKQSLKKNYKIRPENLIHFIPAIIASTLSIILIFSSENQTLFLLHGYFYNQNNMLVGVIGWFLSIFFLVLSIKDLFNYYILSKKTILNNPSAFVVFVIVVFFILAFVSDIIAYISNKIVFMEVSILIISLLIIFLFLINFKYPGYYKTIYGVVESERNKRSYLKGINFKELSWKLDELMDKKEVFIDENISLTRLAKQLEISPHQLSEFLNERKGDNFSSFINKYRIKKAKKMLLENPDEKILAIAYDTGFKSKSTFNSAFAKFANMPPSEFRKKNKK